MLLRSTNNREENAPAVCFTDAMPAQVGVIYCARREFSDSGV